VDIANVQVGDDVAVFGVGPVGYFAVLCAFLRGAARVLAIDHWPARLRKAQDLGALPVNFDGQDPVEAIRDETKGRGAVCIDAVGYEAVGHHIHAQVSNPAYEPQNPMQVMNWISQAARKYSTVGVPGVYLASYDQFPLGMFFNRELQIRMGQCPVKKYNEQLLHMIEVGRIDPTPIISHVMNLQEAAGAYTIFDQKNDVTKVILKV